MGPKYYPVNTLESIKEKHTVRPKKGIKVFLLKAQQP